MRTKPGRDVLPGDEVKYHGRWYTVTEFHAGGAGPVGRTAWATAPSIPACPPRASILLHDDVEYPVRRSASYVQYRQHQRVTYATAVGGFTADRVAFVVADDGGPTVKIRWKTAEGPRSHGGRIVAYHGHRVEQWVPRERLEAR